MSTRSWLSGPSRVWALIRELPEAMVVVDPSGTVLWLNTAAERLVGYSTEELVGRNGLELVDPEDVETAAAALLRTREQEGPRQPWPLRLVTRDGSRRWVEMAPTNLLDDPSIEAVVILARPLDGRQAVEVEARTIEELFRRAFDDAPIGMALVSAAGTFVRVNAAFCELLERAPMELLGSPGAAFTHPDDIEVERPLVDELLAGQRRSYELDKRFLRPDGGELWVSVGVSLVRDPAGEPERFVVHAQDITERRSTQAELAHRATHDPLTGLANRALFDDRLEVALLRNRRLPTSVAVLFCDVDGFKGVNDGLGHGSGDAVLAEVAGRLREAVRPGDTVARFGGDEFVVLCEDLVAERDLDAIAERMQRAVRRPIRVAGGEVVVGLSIGRAMSTGSETAAELLALADADMYRVKGASG